MSRRFRFAAGLTLLIAIVQNPRAGFSDDARDASLNALRRYLADSSVVTIYGSKPGMRDVVSTRIDPIGDTTDVSLTYERATYAGADESTLQSRQIIHYTLKRPALDEISIRAQTSGENRNLWLVTVSVLDTAELIPYSNLVETKKADGSTEVTSSRSKVRKVAIGYCATQPLAEELVKVLRAWLRGPQHRVPFPEPFEPRKPTPLSRSSA